MAKRTCTLPECDRKHCAKGLCRFHYQRQWKSGSTELVERELPPPPTCTIDDCGKLHVARGLCGMHYQRLVNRGTTEPYVRPATSGCSIRECGRPHRSRDWCALHYRTWAAHGDPLYKRPTPQHKQPCALDGCERRRHKGGLCELHARRVEAGTDLHAPIKGEPQPCEIEECDGRALAKGKCSHHYYEAWRSRNREKVDRGNRERYLSVPPEERRSRRAAWYQAHREHVRRQAKQRYDELYPQDPTKWRAAKSRRKMRLNEAMSVEDRHISEDYRRAIAHDPCWYCGAVDAAHVDHFYPLAKGGTDHWWNLRRACATCNMSKHARCGTWFLLRRGLTSGAAGSVPAVA